MLEVAKILAHISSLSVLFPIFFLLKKKENFTTTLIKVLCLLLFASGLSDLISYILYRMGSSNAFINNIYIIIQFFLISYIFYLLLEKVKIIFISIILFTCFFIINISFIQPFTEFQSWLDFAEGILIVAYTIKYYRQLLKGTSHLVLLPSFWINTAIFYYFGANLLIFLCINYVFKNMSTEFSTIFYGFHNFNNTVKNILFAAGIYCVSIKQEEYEE